VPRCRGRRAVAALTETRPEPHQTVPLPAGFIRQRGRRPAAWSGSRPPRQHAHNGLRAYPEGHRPSLLESLFPSARSARTEEEGRPARNSGGAGKRMKPLPGLGQQATPAYQSQAQETGAEERERRRLGDSGNSRQVRRDQQMGGVAFRVEPFPGACVERAAARTGAQGELDVRHVQSCKADIQWRQGGQQEVGDVVPRRVGRLLDAQIYARRNTLISRCGEIQRQRVDIVEVGIGVLRRVIDPIELTDPEIVLRLRGADRPEIDRSQRALRTPESRRIELELAAREDQGVSAILNVQAGEETPLQLVGLAKLPFDENVTGRA
jgi:hypothetical protein